ncbi:peptidase MA family metallohydrolase [Engelhardtia mirabilis]|uniref:Peptidase MA-like domain-containing protein n=1 Tax=Engelhardtia mirabilis TaxID=2528011 RepID=A0A518BQ43_9BACT|nr:hypothetical protein Pla133_41960 [Planctomycetes bacterium Pla133]QDV03407.1 hypothetical protein Pla86_41950 [Planctomycetes bacterium Pla86]
MRGFIATLLGLVLMGGGLWVALRESADPRLQPEGAAIEAPRSDLVASRRPATVDEQDASADDDLRRWTLQNNEACGLLDEGELDQAIALLEECVEARPDQQLFASNLARALYRRATYEYDRAGGNREAALADIIRAVQLDPDDEAIAQLLERWERMAAVEQDFAGFDSMRFNLSFDGDRTDLVGGWQDVVDVLEGAYGEFWIFFSHDPVLVADERIRVVLYERDQFHQATGLGHWAGGAFDGVIRILVDDLRSQRGAWTRTVRHELAHAFVASLGGRGVPGWLNEGVAQWLEADGASAGDRERDLRSAELRLGGHPLRPLADLSGSFSALGEAEAISRAYAESLLLVDYIVRFHGERFLADLVSASSRGSTAAEEFEQRLGYPLERLLEDLAAELDR